jgi:pimeloyl-ACP methyl ester carboxylesterase
MNALQRALLPEMASFNLFDSWPRPAVPVHYVFGDQDPLVSSSIIERLGALMSPSDTITKAPEAGHLVHFDQPNVVREAVMRAHSSSTSLAEGRGLTALTEARGLTASMNAD